MIYEKALKYGQCKEYFMGPNPLKLEEELLVGHCIPDGATVMDLGCGCGITSVFLAKEYGFRVFAPDLWGSPTEHMRLFESFGLDSKQIIPLRADASDLPFAEEFFDAVVCTDSYHYFGRDPEYLDAKLLPFVRHGGYVYFVVPGMKKDLHDDLPAELLLSWTPEDLDTIHDADYWRSIVSRSKEAEIISIRELEGNEELWADWLECDNDYARGDKKAIDAGACRYLNFVAVTLRRR